MCDSMVFTKRFELRILEFLGMIIANFANLSILLFLYSFAKLDKILKGFILGPEEVYPSVPRVVIHDDIPIVLSIETGCGDRSKQIHV